MMMLIRHEVGGFINKVFRSRGGIYIPGQSLFIPRKHNVLAILDGPEGRRLIGARNIVTDAGDLYYAQLGASEATTNAFGVHIMATAFIPSGVPGKTSDDDDFTQIAASEKAIAATYPKTNDGDGDNTGAGTDIVTSLVSYLKADFNDAAISHGIITNAAPGAAEPILTGYVFAAPFGKTADDTLKVFVNHEMLGV